MTAVLDVDVQADFVALGAAWLDAIDPDWPHRVDVDTLDLSSCSLACSWEMLLKLATALRVEPTTIADISAVAA